MKKNKNKKAQEKAKDTDPLGSALKNPIKPLNRKTLYIYMKRTGRVKREKKLCVF